MQPLNFQKLVLDISQQRLVALSDRATDMKNAFAWHLFNTALDRFNSVFAAALQPWLEHVHGWSWVP